MVPSHSHRSIVFTESQIPASPMKRIGSQNPKLVIFLVWDVVLGDFQPERTGPCLVLSEVFGIRPTSGWRTLPGGSTCIFFSQRDLEFPKKFKMFINFPFQEII